MTQLERDIDAHITLITDIYATIVDGGYRESTFAGRIESVQAICRRWKENEDPRIQLAGKHMADLLAAIRGLAKHTVGGRQFWRERARIDVKAAKVAELLTEVNV